MNKDLLQNIKFWSGICLVAIVGVGLLYFLFPKHSTHSRKTDEMTFIRLPPPPPPPPPPPTPPQPKIVQTQEPVPAEKPVVDKPKSTQAPGPMGLHAGNDSFGLHGSGNGNGIGEGGGGSALAFFGGQVQSIIKQTLKSNTKTKYEKYRLTKVNVWCDANGENTRVRLTQSTGDSNTDAAVTEALTGVTLVPPPPGTPMPITLNISEN